MNDTDPMNHFRQQLHDHFESLALNDTLASFRNRAWDRFCELCLPGKKCEACRHLPLQSLYQNDFQHFSHWEEKENDIAPWILDEFQDSHIVLINGFYVETLSRAEDVLSLDRAMDHYGLFLQNRFTKTLKEETDPFSILNFALQTNGAFLYIPPHEKKKIQILNLLTEEPSLSMPRFQLFLGKESDLELVVTNVSLSESLCHLSLDFMMEENSNVQYTDSIDPNYSGWYFESLRASLKKGSRLETLSLTAGAKSVRQDIRVELTGENAHSNLKGLWTLDDEKQSHTYVHVDHQAPFTESNQYYKGLLNHMSKSSFEGKIYIHPQAQKVQSYQMNRNLLLSEGCTANTKPNLEIFADDVKASHGATVSRLNEDELFYMKTRGLSEKTAKHLLQTGYCKELIDDISVPSLKSLWQQHLFQS